MFADDINISFAAPTLSELENVLNRELRNVNLWLRVNKLSLNIAKTECMVIGSRQRLNVNTDGNINIAINDQPIKKVKETETLGMVIDQHLAWSKHVEEKSKKVSSAIGAANFFFVSNRKHPKQSKAFWSKYFMLCFCSGCGQCCGQ